MNPTVGCDMIFLRDGLWELRDERAVHG
jgi:hypothetical protein